MADLSPSKLGRYVIEGKLGQGGFGAVYRGRDERLGADVAIKTLIDRHLGDTQVVQRFINEARMMRQLNHELMVTIHDIDVDEGRPFFVMEYCEGGTLATRLDELGRGLTTAEAVELIDGMAKCIKPIHKAGFVHRDLKPENFLIRKTPYVTNERLAPITHDREQLIVADLGLIRPVDPLARRQTQKIGTPGYTPPEQWHGDPTVDGRADIYAMAGIAAFAILRVPPRLVLEGLPYDTEALARTGPLRPVLEKALSPDRKDRQETVHELVGELRAAATARPKPKPKPESKPARPSATRPQDPPSPGANPPRAKPAPSRPKPKPKSPEPRRLFNVDPADPIAAKLLFILADLFTAIVAAAGNIIGATIGFFYSGWNSQPKKVQTLISRSLLAAGVGVAFILWLSSLSLPRWFPFTTDYRENCVSIGGRVTASRPDGSIASPYNFDGEISVTSPADRDIDQRTRWLLDVREPVADCSAAIARASGVGPDEGLSFAAARVRIELEGDPTGAAIPSLGLTAIATGGDRYTPEDNACPDFDGGLNLDTTLDAGESIEGDVCWAIPSSQIADLILGLSIDGSNGEFYIRLASPHAIQVAPHHIALLGDDPDLADFGISALYQTDEGKLVSGDSEGNVLLWDPNDPAMEPVEFDQHAVFLDDDVFGISAGHNGRIASAGFDGVIRVWDPDAAIAENHIKLRGHGTSESSDEADRDDIFDLATLPDGRLVSTGLDGTVRVWDAISGESETFFLPDGSGWSIAVLASGRLAVGGSAGVVWVWDVGADPADGTIYRGHEVTDEDRLGVLDIIELSDGRIASAGRDGLVHVWDPSSPGSGPALVFDGHGSGSGRPVVSALHEMGDGRLASGSSDGVLLIWSPVRPAAIDVAEQLQDNVFQSNRVIYAIESLDDGRLAVAAGAGAIYLLHPDLLE